MLLFAIMLLWTLNTNTALNVLAVLPVLFFQRVCRCVVEGATPCRVLSHVNLALQCGSFDGFSPNRNVSTYHVVTFPTIRIKTVFASEGIIAT